MAESKKITKKDAEKNAEKERKSKLKSKILPKQPDGEIYTYAYLPSKADLKGIDEAWVVAEVGGSGATAYTDKDIDNRADYKLRDGDYCFGNDGKVGTPATKDTTAGYRAMVQLKYDPKSKVVKSAVEYTQEVTILSVNKKTKQAEKKVVSGDAVQVKFGGIDYIWLNSKDCLEGKATTMKLMSVEMLVKENAEDDLTELNAVITKKCSQSELDLMIPVHMSKTDGYASVDPVLIQESIKILFDDLLNKKITADQLKVKLVEILDKVSYLDNEKGDLINSTLKYIEKCKSAYTKAAKAKNETKDSKKKTPKVTETKSKKEKPSKKQKRYNKALLDIDDLTF